MLTNPQTKYQRFTIEPFPTRTWCNNQLTTAPRWCSSDLRDGNQALINPMDTDKKLYLFNHLVAIGFKEIEVAFPSASETDFNFVRQLIDDKLIPNDVWIQVITQSVLNLLLRPLTHYKAHPKRLSIYTMPPPPSFVRWYLIKTKPVL